MLTVQYKESLVPNPRMCKTDIVPAAVLPPVSREEVKVQFPSIPGSAFMRFLDVKPRTWELSLSSAFNKSLQVELLGRVAQTEWVKMCRTKR